jgi:hypothetical protein
LLLSKIKFVDVREGWMGYPILALTCPFQTALYWNELFFTTFRENLWLLNLENILFYLVEVDGKYLGP